MKIRYNNLYTHFILTTKDRLPIIPERNRIRIEKYITGIIKNNDSKLYAIYINPEHMHLLISRAAFLSEESLATIIEESSEKFINQHKLSLGNFSWQSTASAFSISKSGVDSVCKYILNQANHHKTTSFKEEYDSYLKYYQDTLQKP